MTGHARARLADEVAKAIDNKNSEKEILETAARLIDESSDGYDWTGFYMVKNGQLEVGPYVGLETPHKTIQLGEGICGAAASLKETVLIDDVNADPRFLACSITTKSEIVVPLMDGDTCIGEIDIDSNRSAFFTDEDRRVLEEVAKVVVDRLKSIGYTPQA